METNKGSEAAHLISTVSIMADFITAIDLYMSPPPTKSFRLSRYINILLLFSKTPPLHFLLNSIRVDFLLLQLI